VPEAGLEPFVPRVSLTLPSLAGAKEILFLISGASKAGPVADSFAAQNPTTPAGIVAAEAHGKVVVLLDAEAASGLPQQGEQR
jgi:6-phosphogluconolactonase